MPFSAFLKAFPRGLVSVGSQGQSLAQEMVFCRDGKIWTTDMSGRSPILLCEGWDPEISPDGRSVAFTQYENERRRIAITDVRGRATRVLGGIPGSNNCGPRWSPDGQKLVFSLWVGENDIHWGVGEADVHGEGCRLITEDLGIQSVCSPCWSSDGESVLFHDLEHLYQVDVEGEVLRKEPVATLSGEPVALSSATHFSISEDGKYLAFDAAVRGESIGRCFEAPQAVYVRDLEKGATARVTPKGLSAMSPNWAGDGKRLVFAGFAKGDVRIRWFALDDNWMDITCHIYSVSMDGGDLRRVVRNGRDPSCSRWQRRSCCP